MLKNQNAITAIWEFVKHHTFLTKAEEKRLRAFASNLVPGFQQYEQDVERAMREEEKLELAR